MQSEKQSYRTNLDKGINLGCIGSQVLSLGFSKRALRGDGITGDAKRWESRQVLCQHDCALAHGLQHVQKAVGARGCHHGRSKIQH